MYASPGCLASHFGKGEMIFGEKMEGTSTIITITRFLVARGGPEIANPSRTESILRDGSLEDPQLYVEGKMLLLLHFSREFL